MWNPAKPSLGKTLNFKVHPYQLEPRSRLNSQTQLSPEIKKRQGALLQFSFRNGKMGYADCFPWPELGDAPLNIQLELLRKNQLTEVTKKSLYFAKTDADARANQTNLFQNLEIPLSHYLVTDINLLTNDLILRISNEGFHFLKLKVGMNPEQEVTQIKSLDSVLTFSKIKLRLDFNFSSTLDSFSLFLKNLGTAIELIDFVEDPFLFDPLTWSEIQKNWGVRLAIDRINPHELKKISLAAASVIIIKPAIQDQKKLLTVARELGLAIVFTSYLDHPFGQICAAWSAAQARNDPKLLIETAGLLSQHAYYQNSFSASLRQLGPRLIPPDGSGFGWDSHLGDLKWTNLNN